MRAEFVQSTADPHAFPAEELPEVAVAGRSNVGKSSLINALTGRRALARVSGDPGRTRLINFFRIERGTGASRRQLNLVDLPGYGYARVSREVREAWRPLIESYLSHRQSLRAVVLLVDARRGPEQEEVELVDFVHHFGRMVIAVATKIDKLSRAERGRALSALARALPLARQPIPFSSHTGEGRDELWRAIERAVRDRDISDREV